MTETTTDGAALPEAKKPEEKKPYIRPSLRRLGSVRELTAGGTSPTRVDGLHRRSM
jgi:hypothetical protein